MFDNNKVVHDFCYLGSHISSNGNCEKDVKVRIGKAAALWGKMRKIWRNSNISLKLKTRLLRNNYFTYFALNTHKMREGLTRVKNT